MYYKRIPTYFLHCMKLISLDDWAYLQAVVNLLVVATTFSNQLDKRGQRRSR